MMVRSERKRKAEKSLKKGKSKDRLGEVKVAKKDPTKDKFQCFHYDKDEH